METCNGSLEEEHPKRRFYRLLEKCENLGLTASDLDHLQSLREIRDSVENCNARSSVYTLSYNVCKLIFGVTLIIGFIWLFNWPIHSRQIASTILSLQGVTTKMFDKEECVVEMPHDIQKLFRPPVSCDFCRNVTHIPRVSDISPEEFEKIYAYSGHPVVIVDATKNWTAMNVYSFTFFKDAHKNVVDSTDKNVACQFFPYRTKFHSLDDVFEMSVEKANMKDGSPPWYIGWKNCDFTMGSILRQHYSKPYFLPVLAESSKTDWIFMGSPGYGANLHIDNVVNPSWQAQITGNKRWILEPPPECYYTCTYHMEVVVKPGEIMVLNANLWYHQTVIEGDEIAIAIGSEYD